MRDIRIEQLDLFTLAMVTQITISYNHGEWIRKHIKQESEATMGISYQS